jgi:hypothetical protein
VTGRRLRFLVGFGYAGLGLLALCSAAYDVGMSGGLTSWPLLGAFAIAVLVLELRSVYVNDRLLVSSSSMVALTAGVFFALQDPPSARLAMALLAALGPFTGEDLRRRRIFQPAVNFGQLVITSVVAGWFLDQVLAGVSRTEPSFALVAAAGGAAAVLYTALNLGQVTLIVRTVFGRRNVVPWSGMPRLIGSHALMGLVGGLLGASLLVVGPGLLPLAFAVFAIGHLTFTSYARLREAHESTLRGFVKSLEARDLYTRGHTERVAYFSQLMGEELGFGGSRLETLRYAALIHDLGKLAVPLEIIAKKGNLDDAEYVELQQHAHRVEALLSEVDFLRPAIELASAYHRRLDPSADVGQTHSHTAEPGLDTRVLAVADAFDAMTSIRSYRMATPQTMAIERLRHDPDPVFDRHIVDALAAALDRVGERYGPSSPVGEPAVIEGGGGYG